jgi:1-acyl-sn-glycerol-3-phosphate acyltransferase
MTMARSWVYTIAFLAWTLLVAVLGVPALVSRGGALAVIRFWARGVKFLARTIVHVDYRAEGREHIPPGPCIIAAQHQSSFETYILFLEIERPVFVLKRELGRIPFVGWYIVRAGLVPIDRGAGGAAMRQTLRAAEQAFAAGAQMLIFPEGTRTAPGTRRDYRPGVYGIYRHARVPVIPMALNAGYYWGKTRVRKNPGTIVFKFLPPLPMDLDKETFLATLRHEIESAAATLPRPAPASEGGAS